MRQAYTVFAEVEIRHDYFKNGKCRNLQFRLETNTQHFFNQYGLLLHTHEYGMTLAVCQTQLPILWKACTDTNALQVLRFDLRCDDPYWGYYTDPKNPALPAVFHPDKENTTVLVATQEKAQETSPNSLAEICIPLNPDNAIEPSDWQLQWGRKYTLQLHARSTVWKYLLLGNWQSNQLYIRDTQENVQFSSPQIEKLPNGQEALVTRSTKALNIQEHSPMRFELRDQAISPERTLIPRLPTATPHNLFKEIWQDENITVSEIFINR